MSKEYSLQIYRPLGGEELFLPFKDRTSETETYPKGRYLFIERMPEGRVLVISIGPITPSARYNERYTCTYAPEENWLGSRSERGRGASGERSEWARKRDH